MSRLATEAVVRAREMIRAHCTAAETDLLVESALRNPPRFDISPVQSVTGVAFALAQNPALKPLFLERACMSTDDQQRVDGIADWGAHVLPRYNAGYPHTGEDFAGAFREFLVSLWPHAHVSRLVGATAVGVVETPQGWQLYPMQIVRCMRETEVADRAWQGQG